MDSQITIKLVQDLNWWTLSIQALSAFAIILAAYVAGSYQKKKDIQRKKSMEMYFYSLLKQLQVHCDSFDFISYELGADDGEFLNNISADIKNSIELLKDNFLGIVEFCPREIIHKIHVIITLIGYTFPENNAQEDTVVSYSQIKLQFHKSWENEIKAKFDDVLAIIECDLKPRFVRGVSIAIHRRAERKAKKNKK